MEAPSGGTSRRKGLGKSALSCSGTTVRPDWARRRMVGDEGHTLDQKPLVLSKGKT